MQLINKIHDLLDEGDLTKEELEAVIEEANIELNKAYKEYKESGKSLNDYFKNKKK